VIALPAKRGLLEHLAALGWSLRIRGEECTGRNAEGLEDDAALEALVAAYDELPSSRATAAAAIDAKAEAVRLRYITGGAGQASTYLVKERQAEEFRAAAYAGEVPLMIAAEVEATGLTAQQAADLILAQRDFWMVKGADIERERRRGKVNVDAAVSAAAADAAAGAAIAALDLL
jgi:hypothetical protein